MVIVMVMMMVVMMVVVEILRQLHGLLLGRRGGHMSIVRFEDIERIWDRFQKIAIAGGGGELNRRRGRGLGGMHGGQRGRGAEKSGNLLVHGDVPDWSLLFPGRCP